MNANIRLNRGLVRQYERWMIAMHYAKTTQTTYRKCLRLYLEYLGKRSAVTATHHDIRLYIARLSEEGATLGTAYRHVGVLRLFYNFLSLGGVVSYVAPRFVKLRQPLKSNLSPLTEGQMTKLIAATRTQREKALLEFFYGTGCRLNEVRLLKIEDIDFETRLVKIRGKLGKLRTVILTDTAKNSLQVYIGVRRKGFVFQSEIPVQRGSLYIANNQWKLHYRRYLGPSRGTVDATKCLGNIHKVSAEQARAKQEALQGMLAGMRRPEGYRALSKMNIQQIIRKVADRAALKNVTPRTLRRTFATHLYNGGAGAEVVQALMGHVWLSTTMRYAHISPDRLRTSFDGSHPEGGLREENTHVVASSTTNC